MHTNECATSATSDQLGLDRADAAAWLEVERLAASVQTPRVFGRALAAVVLLALTLGAGAAASGPRGSGLLAGALAPVRYLAVQIDASLTGR